MPARAGLPRRRHLVEHFEDPALAARDDKRRAWPDGTGIAYPRGTGRIGGCTQVNAMVWVRVDDADWDDCASRTGDPFWAAWNMRRVLQLVERCEYRPLLKRLDRLGARLGIAALRRRRGHGFNGYIETTRAPVTLAFRDRQLLRIALETARHALRLGGWRDRLARLAALFDPNDDRTQGTEGFVLTPLTITRQGRRSGGVRDRLLGVAARLPATLTVRTGARVRDIVLEGNRATGVRYAVDGAEHFERAGREVILAAGAFETPALLLRSGIGPPAEFARLAHATAVAPQLRIPLADVGRHLHDRYEISVVCETRADFALLEGVRFELDVADPNFGEWLARGSGVYRTNGVVAGFQMRSTPDLPDPDLYVFCVPCAFTGYFPGYFKAAVQTRNTLTWVVLHENKGDVDGFVRLDPDAIDGPPLINFKYHVEDNPNVTDSAPLVEGVKAARAVIARHADLVAREAWPGAGVQSDDELRAAIESATWGHHANGTARMGYRDDPGAVVDGDLKVVGVQGLRIADASVFPRSPGSFIVSAVVQVGEAAAIKAIAAARGQDAIGVLDELVAER